MYRMQYQTTVRVPSWQTTAVNIEIASRNARNFYDHHKNNAINSRLGSKEAAKGLVARKLQTKILIKQVLAILPTNQARSGGACMGTVRSGVRSLVLIMVDTRQQGSYSTGATPIYQSPDLYSCSSHHIMHRNRCDNER